MALRIDFRNAFPTMSHEFCKAMLTAMSIPLDVIRLIETLLTGAHRALWEK